MKIQEAIRILEKTKFMSPLGQASYVAIEALKKQIPIKPEFANGKYICKCGWDIHRDKQPYCFMCGQKFDWN